MEVEIQHHVHYAHFDQSGDRKTFTVNIVWRHRQLDCFGGKIEEILNWTKREQLR